MEQNEFEKLRCLDTIQCKNHPKCKGRAVDLIECSSIEDNNTACGCMLKDFKKIEKD